MTPIPLQHLPLLAALSGITYFAFCIGVLLLVLGALYGFWWLIGCPGLDGYIWGGGESDIPPYYSRVEASLTPGTGSVATPPSATIVDKPFEVIPEAMVNLPPAARRKGAGKVGTSTASKDLSTVKRGDVLQLTDHASLLRGRALELRPKGLPFRVAHTTKILSQDGTPKVLLISGATDTPDHQPLMISLRETGKARSITLYSPDVQPSTRAQVASHTKWLFAKVKAVKGAKAVVVPDPTTLVYTRWFRRKPDGTTTEHYDLKSELHGTATFAPPRSDGAISTTAILAEYSNGRQLPDSQYLVLELGSNPKYSTIESYSGTKIRATDIEIL